MNNESPADFLKRVKRERAAPFLSSSPSPEFLRIHQTNQIETNTQDVVPEEFFDSHFNHIFTLITSTLSPSVRSEIESKIAVGCVDNAKVNAFIIRSANHKNFAIAINRALVTMTNHYAKMIAAANYPNAVVYCNGSSGSELRKSDYIRLCSKMLEQYGATGKPVGPELKLDTKSDAMKLVESMLEAVHVFVVAHEVGHYLNGDLGSPANFQESNLTEGEMVFGSTNVSHKMEFLADQIAFEIVLRIWRAVEPAYPARKALDNSVILFFNFLREVSNRGSRSHPRPSDRILSITSSFFGADAASLMQQSFDDLTKLREFQEMLNGLTVSDLLADRSSEFACFSAQ